MTDDIVTRLREELLGFHNHLSTWEINAERHEAADEIERLRADVEQRAKLMSQIVELLVPFSMLMNKHEQGLLTKAVRGE